MINETWKNLQEKIKLREELHLKLERSLAIRQIWPEAFQKGNVYCSFIGEMKDGNLQLKIKNETETKTFNLEDVPWVILRHHIRLEIEKSNNYTINFWKFLYQKYQKRS